MPAADDVHRGRVIELDGLAQVAVGIHLGCELALRIDDEGETTLCAAANFSA